MKSRKTIQHLNAIYQRVFAGIVCVGLSAVSVVLAQLMLTAPVYASEDRILQQVTSPQLANADVILDTRPLSSCRETTLEGAVCLPTEDFVAPQRRLANWSGLLWLFGTAGLTGNEHVLVIGEKSYRRHLLAGLLAVAGQKKVSIVDEQVSALLKNAERVSEGTQRSTTRIKVFTMPMRSELLVLRNELETMIHENVVFLDGRSEAEYFGTTLRSDRGGHISGAIHSPLSSWQKKANGGIVSSELPVSYAHDAIEGLTYFSTLLSAGQPSRLYLGGWTEWASHGALPIDSASYAQSDQLQLNSSANKTKESTPIRSNQINVFSLLVGAGIASCLLALVYFSLKGFVRRQT